MRDIIKFPTPNNPPEAGLVDEPEMTITENSRLTFGAHGPKSKRPKKLCECPRKYLSWMTKELRDTDFHEWALAADEYLEKVEKEEAQLQNLEDAADEFLKNHNIDPKSL